MDLSLQLQVQDQDLEEFPDNPENTPPSPEQKYTLFKKKKKKRKDHRERSKKPPHTPETQEAKPPSPTDGIPCLLDIQTAPTPELVYALSRNRRRYRDDRPSQRRRQEPCSHFRIKPETNGCHGRASCKARVSTRQNDQTPHNYRQKFGEDYPRQRRSQTRPRRERETGNPLEMVNPPSHFQRREERMPRGTSPQSRRLDGSHQEITTEHDHITNFKLTLDHLTREWYNNTGRKKTTWKSLTTEFSRYFSTQGKSIRNLHFRWNRFKFNPATDDIEEFICNVQECAAQLNYSDEATMNMIKSCMPKFVYAALYEKETLEAVIEMVINLFAREIEEEQPKTVAPATPFSMVQDNAGPLQDQISKLTDALCNINVTRPFKPYITHRGRGRGRGRGKTTRGRGQPFQFQGKGSMTFPKPTTRGRGHGRGRGKYDKNPTQKKPRVAPKAKDMDKERCHFCKQLGHWERDCPEKKKTGDAKAYDEWVLVRGF